MRQRLAYGCFVIAALIVAGPLRAAEVHNTLSPEELAEGWILLFDGQTDFGWQAASQANWKVGDGVISVSEGQPGLLHTTSEFGDFVLKVDFRCPAATNSGVFLRTPARPTDPAGDCYELNIAAPEVSPFFTGSFVGRQKAEPVETSTEWRSYEVSADGGHFIVKLDGRVVLDYTDPEPLGRGFIGLQLNKGPVEFRNVKLRPLSLDSIFNGRDLAGWRVFPGEKSLFSVTGEGHLHVENGRGQLESEARFGDFVLQLEIFSAGKHLNSGIFFRSIPGELWNGYESQIHNGYAGGDRGKPLDCGTGGFYRRQNARRVVADDFEWFHKTLIVSGPHMAAWVNGYQVSDWTDTRPPDPNPRNGLRLQAGTLIIQGHDPTTNLSFRNLRAAEIPAR
ncbi:MAG: DUF1080 domain-containing protein [Pirellulales bacterium]